VAKPPEKKLQTHAASQTPPAPLLGPSRPPLRIEEGLIAVGWTPSTDEDDADDQPDEPADSGPILSEPLARSFQTTAGVQPWSEWAREHANQPPEARFRNEWVADEPVASPALEPFGEPPRSRPGGAWENAPHDLDSTSPSLSTDSSDDPGMD
jgi:hypothetical protein